jgi:hypothetical protein
MTDGQSANLSWCRVSILGPRSHFCYCQTVAGLLLWGVFSDERTGLSFKTAAGPRQCSHSRGRIPRNSSSYFTVLGSRPPPPDLKCQISVIMPPGTGWPSYIPKHWFPFSSPLTTRRWRYSNPPPCGLLTATAALLLTTSRDGLRRKRRSSVAVQLLFSNGMTYSNVACVTIGKDYT